MEGRWKRWRRALWDPYLNPLLFFAAAYALGISINLTAARLLALKDPTLPRIFLFGGPALIALAILAPKILRRISRTEIDPTAQIVEPAQRHKWLVALASPGRGIETARFAIQHHIPERVWVICSRGGTTPSEESALALKRDMVDNAGFRDDQVRLVVLPVAEFSNPEKVREAIEEIYAQLPEDVEEKDVIIDITGGMKTTTAGAFLAALPPGRHLEVVSPAQVDKDGRGLTPETTIQITIDYSIKKVRRR
jgi:hypothetical protein